MHTIFYKNFPAYVTDTPFLPLHRWVKEIGGMKKILEIFGGIKSGDIKGFRSPHLQPGGDVMFDALNRSGLVYDSTLVAG